MWCLMMMVFPNCCSEGWDDVWSGMSAWDFPPTNDIDLRRKSGKDPGAIFRLYLKPECYKQAYCQIKHYIYFNKEDG